MRTILITSLVVIYHFSFSQRTEFYDKDDLLSDSSRCSYYKTGNYSDGIGWKDTVKTFYCNGKILRSKEFYKQGQIVGPGYYFHPNGKLKLRISYRDGQASGAATEFYPNGKAKITRVYGTHILDNTFHSFLILNAWDSVGKQTVTNYDGYFKDSREEGKVSGGLPDSVWATYKNGRKTLEEKYNKGLFIEGNRYIGDSIVHFSAREIPASPKDGLEGLAIYIRKNLKYPASARSNGLEGRVTVGFVIEKDGAITNVKIIKGFDRACDVEAVRLVASFKPWNPAFQRGLPVRQSYVLPIDFKF